MLEDVQPLGVGRHEAVLDPVVHHLDEVAGAAGAHPVAARLSVVGPGGNRLQHGRHQGPGLGRAARHQGGAAQGAFFVGGEYRGDDAGLPNRMTGQMYVRYQIPVPKRGQQGRVPVVMIHGGGQQGTNFTGTPDGRPG